MTDSSNNPKTKADNHRKFNKIWVAVAFLSLVFILVLLGIRVFQNDQQAVALGDQPQDFSLTTFSGETIETQDLRGKIVLINFWASWCTTCDEEALLLEEAWQSVRTNESPPIVFLGVAYMDTEPASLKFLSNYNVSYPNGPDLQGLISKIYQLRGVPETFILDPTGKLQYVKIGTFSSVNEIIDAIESVALLP